MKNIVLKSVKGVPRGGKGGGSVKGVPYFSI